MEPDLELLRELIENSPIVRVGPGGGLAEAEIRAAEAVVGPLPASFRWWLAQVGNGTLDGQDIATLVPAGFEDAGENLLTRREGDRLGFSDEPGCGDAYFFALDQWDAAGRECPVVRRDAFTGEEEPVSDTFAGFLTVATALALGLRSGPNPAVARLWRITPGLRLPDGTELYGPQRFVERNQAIGPRREWLLVGHDSGGHGLFMRRHGVDRTSVYRWELAAAHPGEADDADRVTGDLLSWASGTHANSPRKAALSDSRGPLSHGPGTAED